MNRLPKRLSETPDSNDFYQGDPYGRALSLLQSVISRRDGVALLTGAAGTGKTTLCLALLDQTERHIFTALILNPFLSPDDLLRQMLHDFGVISRDELKADGPAGVTAEEMVDTLHDFLLGLVPLKAGAVLIVDEAQLLPRAALEQIRILSNLETNGEPLLTIILVGQPSLQGLFASRELQQLDSRASLRLELPPLGENEVTAYVMHRLAAGGPSAIEFTPAALAGVHRRSGGVPALINKICDQALRHEGGTRAHQVTADMIERVAGLDLEIGAPAADGWLTQRATLATAAAVVLLGSSFAVGTSAFLYRRLEMDSLEASTARIAAPPRAAAPVRPPADLYLPSSSSDRRLPADAVLTILIGAYPLADGSADVKALTERLESIGYRVYYMTVDRGADGIWQRVLAGAYSSPDEARLGMTRLAAAAPALQARIVSSEEARALGTSP